MDRFMRPERFNTEPSSISAARQWVHRHHTFVSFLTVLMAENDDANKLHLLFNHVAPSVFDYIADCNSYDEAVDILKALYIKPKSEVFQRLVFPRKLGKH